MSMKFGSKLPAIDLISFAGPGLQWRATSKRFLREARNTGLFREIKIYRKQDLRRLQEPISQQGLLLTEYFSKGYGYWIWKPAVVLDYLSSTPDDVDFVLFCDVGCSFGDPGKFEESYLRLLSGLNNEGPTLVQSMRRENTWTRKAVIDLYEDYGINNETETGQFISGIHFWKKDDLSLQIAREWKDLCESNPAQLLLDPDSINEELSSFEGHRHDQSLLSLIAKTQSIRSIREEWIPWTGSKEHLKPWRFEEKQMIRHSFIVAARVKSCFSPKKTGLMLFPILVAERLLYELDNWLRRSAKGIRGRFSSCIN